MDLATSTVDVCQCRLSDLGVVTDHTPHDHIQDQNNESDNAAAGAVLPCIGLDGDDFVVNRSSEGQSREEELEEEGEHDVDAESRCLCLFDAVVVVSKGEEVMVVEKSDFQGNSVLGVFQSSKCHAHPTNPPHRSVSDVFSLAL